MNRDGGTSTESSCFRKISILKGIKLRRVISGLKYRFKAFLKKDNL